MSEPNLTEAQLIELHEQIASIAIRADKLCYYRSTEHGDDYLEMVIDLLRAEIQRMGLLADIGGREGIRGGAREWLLPPSWSDESERGGSNVEA